MDPYSKIDEKELDSAAHRALAGKIANESMVLLKNDGTLPLKKSTKILVLGPLATQTAVLLGNYNGTPNRTVSILEGIQKEFAGAEIKYVQGTDFLGGHGGALPAGLLTVDGKPGVKTTYSTGAMFSHEAPKILATRIDPEVDGSHEVPSEAAGAKSLMIRWSATLTAPESGEFLLGILPSHTRWQTGFDEPPLRGSRAERGPRAVGQGANLQPRSYLWRARGHQARRETCLGKVRP
jgi:beta-glucosidase